MPLDEYRRKRRFSRTSEPKGQARRGRRAEPKFVVQKHDASRLHYDFRLELDGVLKSWAVPKGPSLDPRQKRLAIQVEDHPIEYAGFEGVIPQGQYGGGTIEVWDNGTWEIDGDANEAYREGKLKFHLFGKKLHGGWALIRTGSRPNARAPHWLLIKERDDEARSSDEYDVVEKAPASVISRRTIDEIAAGKGAKRRGKVGTNDRTKSPGKSQPRKTAAKEKKRTSTKKSQPKSVRPKASRRCAMPHEVDLELAMLAENPPAGNQWFHEIKFDGYRLLCRIAKGTATLVTRGRQDWTARFPRIAKAAEQLPVKEAILDGEAVALTSEGISSFQALQRAFQKKISPPLVYFAFDLLYVDGYDLRRAPLEERKERLAELLTAAQADGPIRLSEHFVGQGPEFFREACRKGLEGIISKRRDRPYVKGRGSGWLKSKCIQTAEFVVGGFTLPERSRQGLGALLVGYHDDHQSLVYCGRVGTGFSDEVLRELRRRLDQVRQDECPFAAHSRQVDVRGALWVAPQIVAQVRFANWTDDGLLRHASFQGLREDKPAIEVTRDEPRSSGIRESSERQPAIKRSGIRENSEHPLAKKRSGVRENSERSLVRKASDLAGVRLTHPERILYPDTGITKLRLAAYYTEVADWILPHVADRPLSIVRCPEGVGQERFFQKHWRPGTPAAIDRVEILEKHHRRDYLVIHDLAGLIGLVQIACLEIHPWGSRVDQVERPDRLTFDLDPGPATDWPLVVAAARRCRSLLERYNLESFVKTTGGKGLHVVAPIDRRHDWPEAKKFAKAVAGRMVAEYPDDYTASPLKASRGGKVFIDYLRNDRGATAVAAYSTRARAGAPVSVPLAWSELSGPIRADQFNVENLTARLASLTEDPWRRLLKLRQSITVAAKDDLKIS